MPDTIELETKIAFLEKHINELSDVVYRQQKTLDELTKAYEELKERHLVAMENNAINDNDEKPPHY